MKVTPAEFASIFESAQEGKRETPITLRHHMKMVAERDGFEVDLEAAAREYEATVGVHMPDLNTGWGEDAARLEAEILAA